MVFSASLRSMQISSAVSRHGTLGSDKQKPEEERRIKAAAAAPSRREKRKPEEQNTASGFGRLEKKSPQFDQKNV